MNTRDDAALAGMLQQLVTAVLDWLADHPDDQVTPGAVGAVRRDLLARIPDPAPLPVAAGLLVDVTSWLDTCDDDEVDPDTAVKALEDIQAALYELPEGRLPRLLAVLAELADAEQHGGRRHQLRLFPVEMGFVDG